MSRSIRLLALTTLMITLALLLRWILLPDDRAPVRLAPRVVHEQDTSPTAANPPATPPCREANLAAWTLTTTPDPGSPYVTLYSPTVGARRVTQGTPLSAQVVLERIRPNEVVVACADGQARRVLTPPQNTPTPAVSERHPAPLGN